MLDLCRRFCSWLLLGCLVLSSLVLACPTRCGVALFRFIRRRTIRSCFVFRRFVLRSFIFSGSVLSRLRLSCLILFNLIRGGFVLSCSVLSSFALRRLFLTCLGFSCLIRFGLICTRLALRLSILGSFIFSSLVLSRLGFSCLVRFGLICSRLALSRSVLRSFVFSGLVLSRLRLSCLVRFGLVLVHFALSCAILSSFVFSSLVLSRLGFSCLVRFGLIRTRFALGRSVLRGFVLRGLVLGRLRLARSARRWSPARRNYALAGKLARLSCRRDCRTPVIHRREHLMVLTGATLLPRLCFRRRSVSRASERFLRRCGPRADSAVSAVIADVAGCVDAHSLVVSVAKVPATEIVHRPVVAELIVAPVAPLVPGATVAESVIHAAVKADFTAPIPATPGIRAIVPSPIARSPEQAFAGRLNPCPRHPEVALVAVGPVARRPEIAFLGADRLRIDD